MDGTKICQIQNAEHPDGKIHSNLKLDAVCSKIANRGDIMTLTKHSMSTWCQPYIDDCQHVTKYIHELKLWPQGESND